MKKLLFILLPLLLLGGIGQAQETPAVTDSAVQTHLSSKFQGLWQQRKGHNLRLEYGFQADLLGNNWVDKYTPLRFDLEYQYDIPWNPKRINFYAYAGVVYKQLDVSYTDDMNRFYELCLKSEVGLGGYIGIGLKIHCTDWLHLSFAQAFSVMNKHVLATVPANYDYGYRGGGSNNFLANTHRFPNLYPNCRPNKTMVDIPRLSSGPLAEKGNGSWKLAFLL